jgi:hypothetical protein
MICCLLFFMLRIEDLPGHIGKDYASQTITMSFGKLLVPEELVTCDGFLGWQC